MLISTSSLLREKLFKLENNLLLQEKADYEKYYADKMDTSVFNYLISLDPTKKKKFETWILNNYLKLKPREQERLVREDGYKIQDALTLYSKGQTAGIVKNPYNDIKTFNSYRELLAYLKANKQQFSQFLDQEVEVSSDGLIRGKDYILLYEDKNWHVVDTLTWRANCYFGSGTSWCTTDPRSSSTFENYVAYSPIIIIQTGGRKFQIHEDSNQYMDANDRPFNVTELGLQMPEKLQKILFKKGFTVFNPDHLGVMKKIKKLPLNKLREFLKLLKIDSDALYYSIVNSDNKRMTYHLSRDILKSAYYDYSFEEYSFDSDLPYWESKPSKYIDEHPALNLDEPDNIDSYDVTQQTKIENKFLEMESDEMDDWIDYNFDEINYIDTRNYSESMYRDLLNRYVNLLQQDFGKVSQEEMKGHILWILEDANPKYEIEGREYPEYLEDYSKIYKTIIKPKSEN